MKSILDYLETPEGRRIARQLEFAMNGKFLGRFTALFMHENRVCFSAGGVINEVPYYLPICIEADTQPILNEDLKNICRV